MPHVAVAGNGAGSIFAIDHLGNLFHNRHSGEDGSGGLVHAGLGQKIGAGWDAVRHLVATRITGKTLLIGLEHTGELIAGVVAHAVSTAESPSGIRVAVPLPLVGMKGPWRYVFAGAEGICHLVSERGALARTTVSVDASSKPSAAPVHVVEAHGWGEALALITGGDGVYFDITPAGVLRYQIAGMRGEGLSSNNWKPLAAGWARYLRVFAGAHGVIYAVGPEGTVTERRYQVSGAGQVQLSHTTSTSNVGSGLLAWCGVAADIEGYAWPLSASPGDIVDFKVGVRLSTPPMGIPNEVNDPVYYSVELRRFRRMREGREVDFDDVLPSEFTGKTFRAARYTLPTDWVTSGAGWDQGFTYQVPDLPPNDPAYCRSGMYAARLTDTNGRSFFVPFVVRPKAPQSPFAILANTNTWNAYNSWGGKGKYFRSYPLPGTLPFQRPHPGLTPDVSWRDAQGQDRICDSSVVSQSCHLLRAELWILGWLEELGPKYAYDLWTDQDLHEGRTGIGDGASPFYKALILNTHPEYWTRQMYDRVKAYRDQGGSIVYLGGNGIYEEVVLSDDGAHMTIFPGVDMSQHQADSNETIRVNCLLRLPTIRRPERALLGVGFDVSGNSGQADGQPYVLAQDPTSPDANAVLRGLKVPKGTLLGDVSLDDRPLNNTSPPLMFHADGWEVDIRGDSTPPEAMTPQALIAQGTQPHRESGEMLSYRTAQGGLVFSAASLSFGAAMAVDRNLQRIVQNALDLCLET